MGITQHQRSPRIVEELRRYFPQVDRVADAKKPVLISVTQKDVNSAKEKAPDACAMALACERLSGIDAALIWPRRAYLIMGTLAVRYRVPESVSREIVAFDRFKDFRPGDYQLSAICPGRRLGEDAKRKRKTGPKKTKRVTVKPAISHRSEGLRGVKPKDAV